MMMNRLDFVQEIRRIFFSFLWKIHVPNYKFIDSQANFELFVESIKFEYVFTKKSVGTLKSFP